MIAVATMQSYLGITGDDAILTAIEAGTVRLLERYTDRLFTVPAATVLEVFDGPARALETLIEPGTLPEMPSLKLKEEPNGGALDAVRFRSSPTSAWVDQDLDDFEVDGREVYLLDGAFPAGRRNIQVEYTFGYAEDAAPPDAHLAVLEVVKHKYEHRDRGVLLSAGVGPLRVTFEDVQKAGMAGVFDTLRRPAIPA